jgi:hypothetical protein
MQQVYSMHQLKTHLSRLVKDMDDSGLVFGERGQATFKISRIKKDETALAAKRAQAYGMASSVKDSEITPDFSSIFADLEDSVKL